MAEDLQKSFSEVLMLLMFFWPTSLAQSSFLGSIPKYTAALCISHVLTYPKCELVSPTSSAFPSVSWFERWNGLELLTQSCELFLAALCYLFHHEQSCSIGMILCLLLGKVCQHFWLSQLVRGLLSSRG